MLRADLAAQRRQLRPGGPAAFVVVPGRGKSVDRGAGMGNTTVMPETQLSPPDLRLMQSLAQQVTALRPELR